VNVHHGDHACIIYSGPSELIAEASEFLSEGLRAGEQCWYAGSPDELSGIRATLGSWVDVPAAEEQRALRLITSAEAYLASGRFDPEQMLQSIDEAIPAAIGKGFTAVRIAGEMSWALAPVPGTDRLSDYEASLEVLLRQSAASAVCFYHRHRMPAAFLDAALASHSLAAVGGRVCPNAFYRSKPIADLRTPQPDDVSWKLKYLQRHKH
jgi:hypothetical protein